MSGADAYQLSRFVQAQEAVYPVALAELRAGSKESHWMWFIFPQLVGLGSSAMARRYALGGLDEARAYLGHPVLGPRLLECCRALLLHHGRSALAILGSPDDAKLRSSMTLFHLAAPEVPAFKDVLDRYFTGAMDPRTVEGLPHQ